MRQIAQDKNAESPEASPRSIPRLARQMSTRIANAQEQRYSFPRDSAVELVLTPRARVFLPQHPINADEISGRLLKSVMPAARSSHWSRVIAVYVILRENTNSQVAWRFDRSLPT